MAEAIVNPVAEKVVDRLFNSLLTQLRYIWNYKSNFENLEKQLGMLEDSRERVQHLIEEATRNRKNIERIVVDWLKSADSKIEEVRQVITGYDENQMKCLKSLCPNVYERYQLGEKAASKAIEVSMLIQQIEPYVPPGVSYSTPAPEVWFPSHELESRTSILKDVMDALNGSDTMVGIHGMGGVGKTTLARGVAKNVEHSNLFNSVIFVELTHPLGDKEKICEIQDVIAGWLGMKFEDNTRPGRVRELVQRLKNEKRVLLILDNIWESLKWFEIGIPIKDDHRGCKVLLTSRDKNVLTSMECHTNFSIESLNEDETWNLFKKIGGPCVEDPKLGDFPSKIAKRCSGLPVAITTVANALKNKDAAEWKDALRQLERPFSMPTNESVNQDMYKCILLSYNHLGSDEHKSIFLLCCMMVFISDPSMENLIRCGFGLKMFGLVETMEEARNRVTTLINKLKGASMLLETSGDECFSIHDVVRDVGVMIASENRPVFRDFGKLQESSNLKNFTSIFLVDVAELPEKLDCPHLTFFYLRTKTRLALPHDFFSEMPELKVLRLKWMDLSELPTSLTSLKKLKALLVERCTVGDISIIGNITILEILVLSNSYGEKKILPEEIGNLNRLRLLDVRGSSFKIPTTIISRLTRLEELYIEDWYDEGQVEPSAASREVLKDLRKLTTLHMRVADAEALPNGVVFRTKLQRYNLAIGDKEAMERRYLWRDMGYGRGASNTLVLVSDTNICSEDGLIKQLKDIEELVLDGKQAIKNILFELDAGGFQKLKHLSIANNPNIECIVESMSTPAGDSFPAQVGSRSFCQLTTIKINGCHKLMNFWPLSIAKYLSLLEEIEVADCDNIEVIFVVDRAENGPVSLQQLHTLTLKNLPRLKTICSGKEAASTSTWNSSSREIVLEEQLDSLPLFGQEVMFPNLKHLQIWHSDSLQTFIFNDKHSCPNLREVHLWFLKNLKRIWQSKAISTAGYMTKLRKVCIYHCESLETIFPQTLARNLSQLDKLSVEVCGVKEIVAAEGVEGAAIKLSFPELSHLSLCYLEQLRCFYPGEYRIEFPKLKELEVRNCKKVVDLFNFQKHEVDVPTAEKTQGFSYLEKLVLNPSQLRSICSSSVYEYEIHFPRLKCLDVGGNDSDALLHSVLEKFHFLEELELRICSNREIFPSTDVGKQAGGFAVLKELHPSSSFKNLKILKVSFCQKIMSLMSASAAKSLPVLEQMSIGNCDKVTQIIKGGEDVESETTFSGLKSLQFKYLKNLTSFYDGKCIFNFPCLEKLKVVECPNLMLFSLGAIRTPNFQQLEHNNTIHKCNDHKLNRLMLQISFLVNPSWSQLKLVQTNFPGHIKDLSHIDQLTLNGKDIEMCHNQLSELIFSELKCLCVSYDESIIFPNKIFGRFKYCDKLERLKLKNCSYEEIFSHEEMENPLFPPQIKFLSLDSLDDLKRIWRRDYKLDLLQNFESLDIQYCNSLNAVLLPPLSFGKLKIIKVTGCNRLESLMTASIARSLEQLEELKIGWCRKMRQVVTDEEADGATDKKITFPKLKKLELLYLDFLASFVDGNCPLEFPILDTLRIEDCPCMDIFTSGSLSTPELRKVYHGWREQYTCKDNLGEIIRQLHEEKIFSREVLAFKSIKSLLQTKEEGIEQAFSNLKDLSFRRDEMRWLLFQSQFPQQELFPCLQGLEVYEDDSTSSFPLAILDRFHTVKKLQLNSNSYEEIFSFQDLERYAKLFAQIKWLSLSRLDNLKQMWKCDSLLQNNIEDLDVESCGSLETLMPPSSSFWNLTRLKVESCDGLKNLFNPTVAKSLEKLKHLEIRNCKMMEEVFSSDEEVVRDGEIVFNQLKFLELYNLSSLTSFCSQNYTFLFPCLCRFTLKKCPKMKFFCFGVLNTPKLVEIKHEGTQLVLYDKLNTVIHEIHQKQNVGTSSYDVGGPSTLPLSTI